jgi:hypothetical protein
MIGALLGGETGFLLHFSIVNSTRNNNSKSRDSP